MSDEKKFSPLQAIRRHCLWCCKSSPYEVDKCPATDCNLYPYRSGKTGRTGRKHTEEEKAHLREILAKAAEAKKAQSHAE